MSSSAVSKQPQSSKHVSRREDADGSVTETKESSSSAGVSAGVNLNVLGALSGAFSGKSKKDTKADGSEVEQRESHARVKGAGAGSMNAQGAAQAHTRDAHSKQISANQDRKHIESSKENKKDTQESK